MRLKWQNNEPDRKTGYVVLMRGLTVHRGQRPLDPIARVFPSENNGKASTVEIVSSEIENV